MAFLMREHAKCQTQCRRTALLKMAKVPDLSNRDGFPDEGAREMPDAMQEDRAFENGESA
jgi:hypothetical protein